jgi:putative membrane protein insertion efficiency factor
MLGNVRSTIYNSSPVRNTLMSRTRLTAVLWAILRIPAWILIGSARVYQYTLSPILGRHCRFHPTCSEYFIEAVRKHGAVGGTWRGIWRICRCNPWNPGGYDPP